MRKYPHILDTIALTVLLTLISSCVWQEKEKSSSQQMEQRIDKLRSLPYMGSTTVPDDDVTGVVLFEKERTCKGYRLYTIAMLGRAELITEEGDILRKWQQPGDRWSRAELLPNGDLLVVGIEGLGWHSGKSMQELNLRPEGFPDSSRYVMKFDWSGKQVWKKRLTSHHDIELTPEGKLLLLTFERLKDPRIHPTMTSKDDHLTLLDQEDGKVVASKSMLDAIWNDSNAFPLQPLRPSKLVAGRLADPLHTNSIEWMHHKNLFSKNNLYSPGKILVCFRHQDRIAIFDWPENRFIWSWGENQISGPHDAQVLKNGHILLFDNGLSRGWSRAIELDPFSREIVWTYEGSPRESFYTVSKGSVQRLPNGNTLLAESDRGRAIEVTSDGDIVWEFICPYTVGENKRAAIVRVVYHPVKFVDMLLTTRE